MRTQNRSDQSRSDQSRPDQNRPDRGRLAGTVGRWFAGWRPAHYAALGAAVLTVAFMLPQRYLTLVLCFVCIHAIAVTGLDILFGYTGQISFGHAGLYAIGAYGSTLLATRLGLPVWLSVILGALLAAGAGAVIAFPASRLVKHFLSLLTIAFGQMIFIIVSITTSLTNGFTGISGIPSIRLFGIHFNTPFKFFFLAAVLLALVLVFKSNLIHSRVGRALIAIRENTAAADGMGINIRYYKVQAFAISAFLCGLAGALYAHLMGFISPDTFNATTSNMFMTELLFGGIATITGPVIGSFILVVVTEVLQSLVRYQMFVYAAFILLVLFFMPHGVVGLVRGISARLSRGGRRNSGESGSHGSRGNSENSGSSGSGCPAAGPVRGGGTPGAGGAQDGGRAC